MFDVTTGAAFAAIDALAQRGQVRAHNIANAETPNFRARHLEFEDALSTALRRGDASRLETTTVASPTVVDGRGNSVDVETEMVQGLKDGLQRDAMVAAYNFKTSNMKMAIAGRR